MKGTALRLALLVVIVIGLSVGTTGFSAVDADRTVSVNVVENDEAYVGVVACEKANAEDAGNGKTAVRVWATNRYTEPISVDAITSARSDRTDSSRPGGTIAVGERERFEIVFESAPDTITVEVTADDFDATITRTVTPKANCPYSSGNGHRNTSTTTTGTATNTSE